MDQDSFRDGFPGRIVALANGAPAFVPADLPPDLPITWELNRLIEDARAEVAGLAGEARLTTNLQLITRAFCRREALSSSALEGTQTEIEGLLLQEAAPERVLEEDSDLYEVLNYLATIELATEWLADGRRLDVPLIKELHARLLKGVRGEDRKPGTLRRKDVYIGNRVLGFEGARFIPPPLEQVPPLLDALCGYAASGPHLGPLVDAALVHYQFETIHPFEDGNGRLGRLLIPLYLVHWGAMDRALLYLSPYLESHAAEYRDGLLAVSQQGAWPDWIRFFLETIRAAASDARTRVRRMVDLEVDFRERLLRATSSKLALPALAVVLDSVIVSVPQLQERLATTAPTARALVEAGLKSGILDPYQRVRGRQTWIARELLAAVYR